MLDFYVVGRGEDGVRDCEFRGLSLGGLVIILGCDSVGFYFLLSFLFFNFEVVRRDREKCFL